MFIQIPFFRSFSELALLLTVGAHVNFFGAMLFPHMCFKSLIVRKLDFTEGAGEFCVTVERHVTLQRLRVLEWLLTFGAFVLTFVH